MDIYNYFMFQDNFKEINDLFNFVILNIIYLCIIILIINQINQ